MLLLMTLLVIFGATVLVFLAVYPLAIRRLEQWHGQRMDKLAPKLEQAWLEVPANKLVIINIFLPICLAIAGLILVRHALGAILGLFIGLALPFIVIRNIEVRRKKKFYNQLVDGVMLLSSSLKAGLSLIQSIEVLVEEMPPPIRQEFGLVLRENKMGITFEDSLKRMNSRLQIEELELLVNALLVARETGGDLTKVLSHLAITIRDRHKIKEKIKTLTLQGRIQGVMMSVLPFAFILWVYTFNKNHFDIMLQTDKGRLLLFIAIVLQTLGIYLIHKFSIIKV